MCAMRPEAVAAAPCAVDVAGRGDRRVHQRRAPGEDLDRFLAQQPARHVEIVDRHVAEQPAGDLDVGDGGGPGSRLVMTTCSTVPIAPAPMRRCNSAKDGSKRRLKPTSIGTPAFAPRPGRHRRAASDRSIGFSQKIALPAAPRR
jgi:hypothetical protein